VFLSSAVIGLFFGLLHCIAWSFHFPSMLERKLWRVCAIAVGPDPALMFLLIASLGTSWGYVDGGLRNVKIDSSDTCT